MFLKSQLVNSFVQALNKTLGMTYMFRLNVANHMVRTVQGVTESILISSFV